METGFIDLHVHSTCSDGTFTPSELVHEAIRHSICAFALTDHDCIDGIKEAQEETLRLNSRMHRKSLPVLNSLVNWMTVKSIWSGYILTRTIKYLITN